MSAEPYITITNELNQPVSQFLGRERQKPTWRPLAYHPE